MATLTLFSDGRMRWKRLLEEREYILGRDKQCDLVVPSLLSSRRHARLSPHDEGFLLEDLDSENGTYVNGSLEIRRVLRAKLTIQIGEDVIVYDPAESIDQDVDGSQPHQQGHPLDQEPDTHGVGPLVLRRMHAAARVRSRPHLSLRASERIFTLPDRVNPIGYGPVTISLGPSVKRRPTVLAEVIQEEDDTFTVRGKGLFGKVTVNGNQVSRHTLQRGDTITIETHTLVFYPGLAHK
jgi:pSer/pThr/pTyr-binding forkhead associated (FHA) protein